MRISIFGLGYVGCVSAACLADAEHEVVGVDVNPTKVDIVNQGRSPVIEPGLEELMKSATAKERLRATTDAAQAVDGHRSLHGLRRNARAPEWEP